MRIVTSKQMKQIEQNSIQYQMSYLRLMENAGCAAARFILETLRAVSKGRVCIVVTHDPRVAASCDSVLELKDGALAARAAV